MLHILATVPGFNQETLMLFCVLVLCQFQFFNFISFIAMNHMNTEK